MTVTNSFKISIAYNVLEVPNVYFAVMTLKNEIPLEIWRRIRQQEESKKDC